MQVALKIDVDTYRGIHEGGAQLASFLTAEKIPASFFVSLGPDNSGWAALRVFRQRGFMTKMRRTSAFSLYGWRTALSGTLFPARPMGASFKEVLRSWRDQGFEVGPHGYDHILWHDRAAHWDQDRAAEELEKVVELYRLIFGAAPTSFAAPGWQAGAGVWRAMDRLKLLYHSDSRGQFPYIPAIDGRALATLEIPTTLSTWDELLALDGMTPNRLPEVTRSELKSDTINVWTIHAELEGTAYLDQFRATIARLKAEGTEWVFLPDLAKRLLANRSAVPFHIFAQSERPGRAGTVTCQK